MNTCSEVMSSDTSCCFPSATVRDAARIMKSQGVASVPIIENIRDKRLVGIITVEDIERKIVAQGIDPDSVRVREIMTPTPVVCKKTDSIEDVLELMEEHHLHRIVIINDENQLVGTISGADIIERLNGFKRQNEKFDTVPSPSAVSFTNRSMSSRMWH